MARIILKQSFAFTDANGNKFPVYFDEAPQNVPDWITGTPDFDALKKSGRIEVVEAAIIPPVVINSTPQPNPEDMAKDENRQPNAHVDANTPPKAGEEAVLTDAEQELSLQKSSGIDGPSGDWTASGQNKDGFPVAKGSPEDVTATDEDRTAFKKAQKGK